MENFKNAIETIPSKTLKLLALVVGLSTAGEAFSQTSMEQLLKEAKTIEMEISQNAIKNGKVGFVNHLPAATITNSSGRAEVVYADNERTKPVSFLVCKDKNYYWDGNADGKIDAIYLDKNENTGKNLTDEEFMKAGLMIRAGGPSQEELDLSDMTNEKFVFFNLENNTISDTSDKEITKIPESKIASAAEGMQKKFVSNLKDWKAL